MNWYALTFVALALAVGPPQDVPLPPLDGLEPAVAAQLQAAGGDLQQAIAADAGARRVAEAYGSLGQILHAYEFFDLAEAAYLSAARLTAGDVRWRHLLGYLYQQTGRLEESAEQFAAVRRLPGSHAAAAVHLGEVSLALNRLREAREQFESVAGTFPAVARYGLGEIALREGRFAAAVDHFRAVLDRLPQAGAVHYPLAMAYRGLGRLDDARAHLQQQGRGGVRAADPLVDGLQALVRGERALVIQGRRAYEAGLFAEAAAAFRQAVAAAPDSAAARANFGLALAQAGNTAGAVEQFEAALRLEPDNLVAHSSLGMWLVAQGRDDEALVHLAAAVERAPDDEQNVVTLAILLAGQDRLGEALRLLDEANRRFPERVDTATTLARLLASAPDRSLRDGRRALELAEAVYTTSSTPVHGETVALALAELGRCGEAAAWIRRASDAAEQAGDTKEAARLRGEGAKYGPDSCRR